jgi:DNA primase
VFYKHEKDEPVVSPPTDREKVPYPMIKGTLWGVMRGYLAGRDLSFECAQVNLWYPSFFKDESPRIVIPCTNSSGFPYFQARAMDSNPSRYESPWYPRMDSLVVVFPIVESDNEKAVIVEGPMDALAAGGVGHLGIGLMGANPNESQIYHLIRLLKSRSLGNAPKEILVVPDQDSPELGPMLISYLAQSKIKSEIRLPEGKDLAAMAISKRKELLR